MTVREYKEKFPDSPIITEEIKATLSQHCKEQNKSENFGFKNGHKINQNKEPWNKNKTKESDEKIAQYAKKLEGRKLSPITKMKLSESLKKFNKENPDHRRGEKNGMFGKKLSESHLKALWSTTYQTINKVESEAYRTLKQYGFEYVGDRKFWITFKDGTHKCPDFINKKMRMVVEIYGDYWHKNDDPNEIINKYKEKDWDCIVIWEHEITKQYFGPEIFEEKLGIFEEEDFTFYDFNGKWMQ